MLCSAWSGFTHRGFPLHTWPGRPAVRFPQPGRVSPIGRGRLRAPSLPLRSWLGELDFPFRMRFWGWSWFPCEAQGAPSNGNCLLGLSSATAWPLTWALADQVAASAPLIQLGKEGILVFHAPSVCHLIMCAFLLNCFFQGELLYVIFKWFVSGFPSYVCAYLCKYVSIMCF